MGVQNRTEKYIKLLIYLVVVVLINVVGMTLFFRVDLTRNGIYSISDVSKKVVSTLSEPLTVNVFFSRNLPAPHNQTERYLHDLLEEYAVHANTYFNYRFYDVSPEGEGGTQASAENQKLADSYGIHPVQIQAVEQDEVKFKKAYMGLVLIHGDMIERIPTLTSTEGLEYKLTTAIQKLNNKISALLSLEEKIRINLFVSSSLQKVAPYMGLDDLPDYPGKIRAVIDALNDKTYGRLEFASADPTKDRNADDILKKYNIMSLKWPAISEENIPPGSGVIGMVMEYSGKTLNVPLLNVMQIPLIGTRYDLTDVDELEELINGNIEALVNINEDLGWLAGHGTLRTAGGTPMGPQSVDTLNNFASLVSQNYSLKPLHLEDEAVPESLGCLVIARPTQKFTDYELYQIDQALMRGTSLALFLDAFEEKQPQVPQNFGFNPGPTFEPIDSGLEKLLEHYGIRIKKSFVMDKNCYRQRTAPQFGGGERAIYFAPLIKNENINNDFKFMQNIKGLIAVKISPLELDEKRIAENNLNAGQLFSSSEKSWEMKDRITLNPMFIRPPASDENMQRRPLACLIEGEFPSYFAGKPIPQQIVEDPDAQDKESEGGEDIKSADIPPSKKSNVDLSGIEGRGGFVAKGRPARIFLMASSEMIKDNVLDAEGRSPNAMFVMNVIDSLNHREDIAVMRSKIQRFNPLYDTEPWLRTFVKTFNIAGLTVLVIGFGLVVWLRRHGRKKRIQLMFRK